MTCASKDAKEQRNMRRSGVQVRTRMKVHRIDYFPNRLRVDHWMMRVSIVQVAIEHSDGFSLAR